MTLSLCLLFYALFPSAQVKGASEDDSCTLHIQVENIEKAEGHLLVAIFNKEGGFPEAGGEIFGAAFAIEHAPNMQIEVPHLKPGRYAVALYHDLNGNNKLDKNVMGIPVEPYGFSNNPKVKWSPPSFEKASFEFGPNLSNIQITLNRWKRH